MKVTFLNSSSQVIIGKPIPSGACKGMPEDEEGEIYQEEEYDGASCAAGSSTDRAIKSLNAQLVKAGLRSHDLDDDDDDDVEEIDNNSVNIAEMIKRHNELNEQLSSLTVKVNEFNQHKEDFKNDITKLANENTKLKKKYEKMKKAKVMGKQRLIENYLEITGIQTRSNENLLEIIEKIATVINVPLNSEVDIVSVTRDSKTRAILVCCNSSSTKQKLLEAKRGKHLSAEILCLDIPRKNIQIHELLTSFNKLIMFQARKLQDKGVFDFVWSKDGRVFVKSPGHGRALHVYCLEQLKRFSKS